MPKAAQVAGLEPTEVGAVESGSPGPLSCRLGWDDGMTAKLPQLLCRTQSTTLRRPPGETVTILNLWERCSAWGRAPGLVLTASSL